MSRLTVVCMLWDGEAAYRRARYGPRHVNALYRMVSVHLGLRHDFVCLTDDQSQEFNDDVHAVRMPDSVSSWPKRYPKLILFSPTAKQIIGRRFLYFDLDIAIVRKIDSLITDHEFRIWSDPNKRTPYNSSMILMDAGSRPKVWSEFDVRVSPKEVGRYIGTDQAWISTALNGEATWGPEDGVISYRRHCKNGLRDNARVVHFHGKPKPWELDHDWIPEVYG